VLCLDEAVDRGLQERWHSLPGGATARDQRTRGTVLTTGITGTGI
jgi:hypothetical protein